MVDEAKALDLDQSSSLMACATEIWRYPLWAKIGMLPPLKNLRGAEANRRGLSAAFAMEGQRPDHGRRQEKIEAALQESDETEPGT